MSQFTNPQCPVCLTHHGDDYGCLEPGTFLCRACERFNCPGCPDDVRQMARTVVTVVTYYPELVTPTMHAGIDLARALASGDVAITADAVLAATIIDVHAQLTAAVARRFL